MYLGIFIMFGGFLFLLQNLGFFTSKIWDILWPVVIIMYGLYLITERKTLHVVASEQKKQ